MTNSVELSVVVPSYNELKNIAILLKKLASLLHELQYEIIVVDDNSPDKTWDKVATLSKQDSRIRLLRRFDRRGLSSAILEGFSTARGKYICVLDADMQHDETKILDMIEEMDRLNAEIVVGSRKVAGGGVQGWTWQRRFMSWVGSCISRAVVSSKIKDPMSGFFMLRQDFFRRIVDLLNPRGFKLLMEIINAGNKLNPTIREVGYVFKDRQHGKSKLNSTVILDFFLSLYDIKLGAVVPFRVFMYCLVGLSGVFINMAALGFFVTVVKLTENSALLCAIFIAMLSNFVCNNLLTFRDYSFSLPSSFISGFIKYLALCSFGALINYTVSMFFFQKLFWSIYLSNLIGIAIAMFWNYVMNSKYTWKV